MGCLTTFRFNMLLQQCICCQWYCINVASRICRFSAVPWLSRCQVGCRLQYTPPAREICLRAPWPSYFSGCRRVTIQAHQNNVVAFLALLVRVENLDLAFRFIHMLQFACYLLKSRGSVNVISLFPSVCAFVLGPQSQLCYIYVPELHIGWHIFYS